MVALILGDRSDPTGGDLTRKALLVVAELAITGLASWTLRAAPRRLGYQLRRDELMVRTLAGRRVVTLSSIASAEPYDYQLTVNRGVHLGWPRSHMPGYYSGRFRLDGVGAAQVAVAARRGHGVLLRFQDGPPLLLAPKDPEALLRLIGKRGGETGLRSASSPRARRRR